MLQKLEDGPMVKSRSAEARNGGIVTHGFGGLVSRMVCFEVRLDHYSRKDGQRRLYGML